MNKPISKYYIIIFILIISPYLLSQSFNHKKYYPAFKLPLSYNDYLFSNYVLKTNTELIRMDSIITHSIQGSSLKLLFQYNDNNKIKEWLILGNNGSGWSNSDKHEMYYDEQGNLITGINLDWNINEWDSASRIDYSYNIGMLSQSVFQIYKNNAWTNLTRSNYTYDSNNNLLTRQVESWNNDKWQNNNLITYYSTQNKNDSILFQSWVNNDWQNDKKTVFYYSNNAIDLDSLIAKSWDGFIWLNYLKREFVNDVNHNQIEQLDKVWNADSWLNSIGRFFTYNEFNFIEYVYCEIWYNNQWMTGDGDILFQNPDGFTLGFITNNVFAYYSNIVSIDENENIGIIDYSLSQNYPNPFNPSTLIEYKIPKSNFVEIKVYDVLGNEIATLVDEYKSKGIYEVQFNANNLPSGVYIYHMKVGNFSQSKKMILMR